MLAKLTILALISVTEFSLRKLESQTPFRRVSFPVKISPKYIPTKRKSI